MTTKSISYGAFSASGKTLDLSGAPGGFVESQLLLVTNQKTSTIIYSPAIQGRGIASVASGVVHFQFDTSGMSDSDPLVVRYDDQTASLLPANSAKETGGNLDALAAGVSQVIKDMTGGGGVTWTALDVATSATASFTPLIASFVPGASVASSSWIHGSPIAPRKFRARFKYIGPTYTDGWLTFGVIDPSRITLDGVMGGDLNTGSWNGVFGWFGGISAVGTASPQHGPGSPDLLTSTPMPSGGEVVLWVDADVGKMAVMDPSTTVHDNVQSGVGGLVATATTLFCGYRANGGPSPFSIIGVAGLPAGVSDPSWFSGGVDVFAGPGQQVNDYQALEALRNIAATAAQLHSDLAGIAATDASILTAVTAVSTAVAATTTAVTGVHTAITALDADVQAGNTSLGTINGHVANIDTATSGLATALAALESAASTTNADLGQLHTDNAGINSLITSGNALLTTISGALSTISSNTGTANTDLAQLHTDLSSVLTSLSTLHSDLGTANGYLSTVAGTVSGGKVQVQQVSTDAQVAGGNSINAVDVATTPGSGSGQTWVTGTPTANSYVSFALAGMDTVNVVATSSTGWAASGSIQAEIAFTGTGTSDRWFPINGQLPGAYANANAFSADFLAIFNVAGAVAIRFRATAWADGTKSVAFTVSKSLLSSIQRIQNATFKAASTGATAADTALVAVLRDLIAANISQIGGVSFALGSQTSAASAPVVQASDYGIASSGTVTFTGASQTCSVAVPPGAQSYTVDFVAGGSLTATPSATLSNGLTEPLQYVDVGNSQATIRSTSGAGAYYEGAIPKGATSINVRSGGSGSGATCRIDTSPIPNRPGEAAYLGQYRANASVVAATLLPLTTATLTAGSSFTGTALNVFGAATGIAGAMAYAKEYRAVAISDMTCTLYLNDGANNSTWYPWQSIAGTSLTTNVGPFYRAEFSGAPKQQFIQPIVKNTSGSTNGTCILTHSGFAA